MKVSMVQESSMHALLQISNTEYDNLFKRITEVLGPDYKLCIDILKLCVFSKYYICKKRCQTV